MLAPPMRPKLIHRVQVLALCALLSGAAGAVPAHPQDSAQAKQKLDALRARIGAIGAKIAADNRQRDTLSAQLRDAELSITEKRKGLEDLRIRALALQRHRSALQGEQAQIQTRLDDERAILAGQLRAAYMSGNGEEIKLLLNQSNPAEFGRMLADYGYFGRARAAQIESIQSDMSKLQATGNEIDAQGRELQTLQTQAAAELDALVQARGGRAQTMLALNRRVETSNQELARLRQEAQALESLLADLARVLPEYSLGREQPFANLKGKLPWPVAGKITAGFNQSRGGDDALRWNGVMIDAARGAKIRAPYYGRVAYADWLQGLGLLMIIQHGGGYLTLFGHAEVLYKRVGDTVSPGDVIAAVADADGTKSELYFELRQGRKPLDPRQWMRR
jgi:murein hydrolase activator